MSRDTDTMLLDGIDCASAGDGDLVDDLELLVQASLHPNTLVRKLSRALNILRYYRTSQLVRRALRMAVPARLAGAIRVLPSHETHRVRADALEKMRRIAAARSVRVAEKLQSLSADLSRGRFALLEQALELGTPIDWHGRVVSHPSQLWTFHLHYHEYLLDLATRSVDEDSAGSFNASSVVWGVVANWIESNPLELAQPGNDAWHPYCISRRLPVWAQLFATNEPHDDLRDKFLQSFAYQAEVLCNHLEFDLDGNHLLENLRALALAGAFFDGSTAERWLDLATRHLRQQLPRQILPHGEHYERAPMYHCQALGNLLQIAVATGGVRDDLAGLCREAASGMHDFLQSILHPDGEIPLFGDSCWGEAHAVEEIDALAKAVGLDPIAKAAGPTTVVGPYWTWRDGDDALIFDAGPVGAGNLPAHAHCDLLGFEASVGGQRWFVDSGLYDYDEGEMRDYCRASAAHNVVTVGDQNCCDVWSRFRMGRRGRPTRFEQGRQGRFSWCRASHDGYRHLGVPELSRMFVVHSSGVWTCLDHAPSNADSSLVGRLHLSPGVEVRRVNSLLKGGPQQLALAAGRIQRLLTATSGVELGLAKGWYCDRFGRRTRTQVITYRPKQVSGTGCTFGWALSPDAESSASVIMDSDAAGSVQVAVHGDAGLFRWHFSD